MTTESPTPQTNVVIADDHPIFRAALRKLLETDPGIRVVGEAGDGRDAIRMVSALRPDLLLLDLVMPVKGGLDTLQELSTMDSPTRTLLLAAEVADSDLVEALQFGARGIVMKQSASELLFKSIRTVMAGQSWIGASAWPISSARCASARRRLRRSRSGRPSASRRASSRSSPRSRRDTPTTRWPRSCRSASKP